jgi:hypothetical protein
MAEPPREPVLPEFATIPMWRELTGMGRSKTYEELGARNLRGVKCGRVVLIDVKHGLEWLRSLPPVVIRPRTTPRRRRTLPTMVERASLQAEQQQAQRPAKKRAKHSAVTL